MIPARAPRPSTPGRTAVVAWLGTTLLWVLGVATVGAATRLEGAGLSITEWEPLRGAIPPLTQADWEEAFRLYRASPQFLLVNHQMDLDGFRVIFWWEWIHRFLARTVGLVFLVPLVWLSVRGVVQRRDWPACSLVLVLGGMQGAIGWFMVASGLVDEPRVSPLRLALHFGGAMAIAMTLVVLMVRRGHADRSTGSPRLRLAALVGTGVVFTQGLLGALVAGTKAGWLCPDWPRMCGVWVPTAAMSAESGPMLLNPFFVQFLHRSWAWVAVAACLWLAWVAHHSAVGWVGRLGKVLAVVVLVQLALGVATLVFGVPTTIAVVHQLFGLLTLLITTALAAVPVSALQSSVGLRVDGSPRAPAHTPSLTDPGAELPGST